jgi:hypothetical protein
MINVVDIRANGAVFPSPVSSTYRTIEGFNTGLLTTTTLLLLLSIILFHPPTTTLLLQHQRKMVVEQGQGLITR